MKITVDAGNRSHFAMAIRSARDLEEARTGVHCSSIIRDIQESQEKANTTRPELDESTVFAFQETGNVIEEVMATSLAAKFPGWEKPAPRITEEGISCAPDGWSPRFRCIDEVKVCWKSFKDFLSVRDVTGERYSVQSVFDRQGRFELLQESDKFFFYRLQTFFYMHVWGAERCRIHVLFLNGDYRPPFPMPVTFSIKPEPDEVRAMYELLVNHARDRKMIA